MEEKKNWPLISIITVCYNAEKSIERTLKSVIKQNYDNIEYIIIDGASSDKTLEIIHKYSQHISLIISESDKGVYDAMNKGINLASGEWINFMNSGDTFYDLNVLTNIHKHITPKVDIIYGDTCIELDHSKKYCLKPDTLESFQYKLPFCHQSCFIKTTLAKSNLFDLTFKYVADYAMFYHLYNQKANFKYINTIISIYQIESGLTASNSYLCNMEKYKVNGQKISIIDKLKMRIKNNILNLFPKIIIKFIRMHTYQRNKRFILITRNGNQIT